MKLKCGNIFIFLMFCLFLFLVIINLTFSLPPEFSNPRTCFNTWSSSCNSDSLNDAFNSSWNGTHDLGCSGIQAGTDQDVQEVYLNASAVVFGNAIEAKCQFYSGDFMGLNTTEFMFYYNGSTGGWIKLNNWTSNGSLTVKNRTVVFKPNDTEGTHYIRCSLRVNAFPTNFCANWTGESDYGKRDNDDVNFNVTSYPKYTFWNLTNYTTGENITDYILLTRNDKINASAHWNKEINLSQIRHNGTGSFHNYTIFSPYEGNWTNYTLNITNSTEFSKAGVIEISYIWVNDSYGLENYTSNPYHLNLSAGNPPNVSDFFFSYGDQTDVANKYTQLVIFANVSDDVGLSAVIANITYPNGNSTNVSMRMQDEGHCNYLPEWCTWQYTFGDYDVYLNETGPYTIRITAIDIGNQSKKSGVDEYSLDNITLTVYDNYTLNLTSNYSLYMRGENVTLEVINVYNVRETENVNWTVNVTKINEIYNFTFIQDVFNYTIKSDDPEGNYSIFANASKDNNTGNLTWNFNVSKNLTVTISTTPTYYVSKVTPINILVKLYNARGEIHNSSFETNLTCADARILLPFVSGQASTTCNSPSTPNTLFYISINLTDPYNNTGHNFTTLKTISEESNYYSPGGSGGFTTPEKEKPKNCSDGTLYNQCSPNRPSYCVNGTLIKKCFICGCESPDYKCQPDGTCAITKEEDFTFEINTTKIEMIQGGDKEIIGYLKNTGNTILNLISFLNVSENCCNVSLPSTFELNEKEERQFGIAIHIPLSSNISEYFIKIGIGTKYVRKERIIDLIIRKSPFQTSLADMQNEVTNLENEIQEIKNAGIDTRNLETLIGQSKALLNNANSSISNDQANVLQNSLADLQNNVVNARSILTSLRTQKFLFQNAWLIGLLIVMSMTTMYMVPQVLIPLNKKDKELSELKEEEEALVLARVETEKQYFMRKIDENTFSKIMIGKQDRILKVRAMIKERENEKSEIIKSLSPITMLVWFGRGIKNIPKRIKNIPKRILKRKDNIDKDGKTQ